MEDSPVTGDSAVHEDLQTYCSGLDHHVSVHAIKKGWWGTEAGETTDSTPSLGVISER